MSGRRGVVRDEEIEFGEEEANQQNIDRMSRLADTIGNLKTSALYFEEKAEQSERLTNETENEMDTLFDVLYSVKERLKRLFGEVSMSHLFILVIGCVGIFFLVYFLCYVV